jgi:predicted MPP superfamily phosphohydrolase
MHLYPLRPEEKENRRIWASVRATLEVLRFKYKRNGKKSRSKWTLFERLLSVFKIFLRITGLYQKGLAQAKDIRVENKRLFFNDLPNAFNGFKILHLSDLHIDAIEGLEEIILKKIQSLSFDLCVITGDFRMDTTGSFRQIIPPMQRLLSSLHPPYGILAVLGNHDTYRLVNELEPFGVRFLVNETVRLEKNGQHIRITGIDDTYYFYTDRAQEAFEQEHPDFAIALAHTGEMSDIAADNSYRLYLCGHTHGGQICLPGGIPVITHQKRARNRIRGIWQQNGMTGYTSPGAGVSGIPIRLNCPPEVTLFELKTKTPV